MPRSTLSFFLFACTLTVFSHPVFAGGETLTFTTYYPAPFGSYDQVRLVPRDPLQGKNHNDPAKCQTGLLYTDKISGLTFCRDDGQGQGIWQGITSSLDSLQQAVIAINLRITTLSQDLNKKITDLKSTDDKLQQTIDDQQKQISQLQSSLTSSQTTIAQNQAQITVLQAAVIALTTEINNLKIAIAAAQAQ